MPPPENYRNVVLVKDGGPHCPAAYVHGPDDYVECLRPDEHGGDIHVGLGTGLNGLPRRRWWTRRTDVPDMVEGPGADWYRAERVPWVRLELVRPRKRSNASKEVFG